MTWNHQLQYNVNYLEISFDKTLLTLMTALRDGLKSWMETGSTLDRKRSGRPSIDEETVDAVRVALHYSPRKSICVVIWNYRAEVVYVKLCELYFVKYSKFIWCNMNWFSWATMKCYTHSINIRSKVLPVSIQLFKPSLNAVSVRRVLSKLISKFTLYCSWWFQVMVRKNTLCFLLNGQHVSYFIANSRLH